MIKLLGASNIEKNKAFSNMGDILKWIADLNDSLVVNMTQNKLSDSGFWFYDATSGIVITETAQGGTDVE